jgi:hypothetical protein
MLEGPVSYLVRSLGGVPIKEKYNNVVFIWKLSNAWNKSCGKDRVKAMIQDFGGRVTGAFRE